MAIARFINSNPGGSPTVLLAPPSSTDTGTGIPQPQFVVGQTLMGPRGGEWQLCTLVLAATTSLLNGQAYAIDTDFVATLLSTSNSTRGYSVGIGSVQQASVVAGTYYIWLQINGHAGVLSTGAVNSVMESTATAGTLNAANTPTSTAKTVVGASTFAAVTFTADNTNGSLILTNVSSFNNVSVGATLAGTGVGSGAKIVSYATVNGVRQITVDTASTATNAGVTVTQTGVIPVNLTRPYVGITN